MSESSTAPSLQGHCLCGAVTVTARAVRGQLEACHCRMCRRWGGLAFLGVQCGSGVTFTGKEFITRYASSGWAERGFCSRCGSNLFYRFVPADNYSFPAGLFDDIGDLALEEEIFVDEQPAYYAFSQEAVRKSGAEIIAEAEQAGFTFDK